ncbi:MAG: ABC transporter permease subunit [Chloroflexi bacterium]|jgi:putative spermidine/putrescine transport system permease protein|uniref:Spermidine/putrescine ABC transporter permease n=1 Tax=Candidatus Thermofonsia Clade 3 bacterium TaxID=2364212 RepID=A0A2M8QBV5_9CHLR|nr:ABC transporter permease subunit [Candidatus Roseilinea sp. NK_OTU-006]PJF47274.1 MAG: spermidine/putrescine ABC transporter permease [Candidatus Thermofonsia Clade 3 bacterium]RMG62242.1 MAG: ABC transporter permease subunit [Chloroflexota bacterium]
MTGGRSLAARLFAWAIFIVCAAYLIVPLATQFDYSLRARRGEIGFTAYTNVLSIPEPDKVLQVQASPLKITLNLPRFYSSLLFSCLMAVLTIIVSTAIVVPTAYWVHLRVPRLKPVIEFFTVLPFAIPGIVLTFGLLRTYSGPPFSLTNTELGTVALLVGGYTIAVLPYTYRSVDIGLRAIDIRTLTEAARSLGAGWPAIILQVILPNLRVAVLSAALLTFAIAIGEYTLANFLFPDERAFGSYMASVGNNKIFEPAALTIISFVLVWILVLLIQRVGRGTGQTQMTGMR